MNKITLGVNQSIYPIYDSPYREIKIDDAFIVNDLNKVFDCAEYVKMVAEIRAL